MNRTMMLGLVAALLFATAGCGGNRIVQVPVVPPMAVPGWVDQPAAILAEGTVRTVGYSGPWLSIDAAIKAAEQDGERKIASAIGGSHLWTEQVTWFRDHPVLGDAAKELGLGEKFLRNVTYGITEVSIPSVLATQWWQDKQGQKGEPNGVFHEVIAPAGEALAAVLLAKSDTLKKRLAELREKQALSEETEAKVDKAVDLMVSRARTLADQQGQADVR